MQCCGVVLQRLEAVAHLEELEGVNNEPEEPLDSNASGRVNAAISVCRQRAVDEHVDAVAPRRDGKRLVSTDSIAPKRIF